MTKGYVVSVEAFEGPIDLLYQLIAKRKLQINTVSLAQVTADYLHHTRQEDSVNAEDIAHFMHIAAILILIKSRSLLDILEYTEEEEADVQQLEDRVKLFEYVRERAVPVLRSWQYRRMYAAVPYRQKERILFSPDQSCTVRGLNRNARAVAKRFVFLRKLPEKRVARRVLIEEVVEKVLATVSERVSVSFQSLSETASKGEKIVSFLAVLELIKKNLLHAHQSDQFDDIMLSKRTV